MNTLKAYWIGQKNGCMRIAAVIVLFYCLPTNLSSFEGPLSFKNQFPLTFHLASPLFETARGEEGISMGITYSSIYLVRRSAEWDVGMDIEMAELEVKARKMIGDSTEMALAVPVISFYSGFMDGLIESYHDAFGFPDYGRSDRPHNSYLYEVRKDGKRVVKGKNGDIGIGDIRLSAKRMLLKEDLLLSLKLDLELPTGDPDEGYGSGDLDLGVSILIDKAFTERIKGYGTFGMVYPGDLKAYEDIDLKTYLHGGISLEAVLTKGLSLLGQVQFQTSPFHETDITPIDRTAVLLGVGVRYRAGKNVLECSFVEDPSVSGAPDFMIHIQYKRRIE